MKPYFQEGGVTIYHGDCREILPELEQPPICITDPVWPNSVFTDVADPAKLFAEAAGLLTCERLVVHLGCNSDPRFLWGVPSRLPFFRVCSLEYAQCSYVGRLLYTGDVAYVFGNPPPAAPGRMVLPGKTTSTGQRRFTIRGTGRNKHKSAQATVYEDLEHPCARDLDHVGWLMNWYGGPWVLDPFMGIGTTLIAAKDFHREAVGIERNEAFCEIAASRLSQGVMSFEKAGVQA